MLWALQGLCLKGLVCTVSSISHKIHGENAHSNALISLEIACVGLRINIPRKRT